MFERFTERARQVVVLAQEEARTLKHNYIGTEHILLGLLREEEGVAGRALARLDITVEHARSQILEITGQGEEVAAGQIPFTPRTKKVLELALRQALDFGHNYIGTEHILLGLVRENEGVAARVLSNAGADADRTRDETIRMMAEAGVPIVGRRRASTGTARDVDVAGADPPSAEDLDDQIGRLMAEEKIVSEQLRRLQAQIDVLRARREDRRTQGDESAG